MSRTIATLSPDQAETLTAEAAQIAEAAHRRRLTSESLTAETEGRMEVRRGVWVELTAEVLADTRRKCWRLLPYNEAEDMAADVLTRELEAAEAAGRKNCVRAERLTATYLKLTALDWRTGREAARLAELSDDETELSDEDIAPVPDEDEDESADANHFYRQAASVCRRLYLIADASHIYAMAEAVSGLRAAELSAAWGVSLSTWQHASADGKRDIRASYPDLTALVSRLTENNLSLRQTPIAERRIGADIPEVGRHRTAAQLDREADVLLARPQLPGRKCSASPRTDSAPRIIAPPLDWRRTRPLSDVDLAEAARRIARLTADPQSPRNGPRPHRQAAGVSAVNLTTEAAPIMAEDGWGAMYPQGATCAVLSHREPMPRTAWYLPTWQPGAVTARPRTVQAEAPSVPADVLASEAGAWRTRREVWRLVFTPPHKRAGALIGCSLDVQTHEQYMRDSEAPFKSAEDMAAEAA